MKKLCLLTIPMLMALTTAFAQQGVANQKHTCPHTTVQKGNLKITYGQPSKNGQEIFGQALPFHKIWCAGADEATQITFTKDCTINGFREVKAGTYTLFIIPDGKKEWTLVLNSQLNQCGASEYE